MTIPRDQEATLPQPPKVEQVRPRRGGLHVGEERVIFEERLLHARQAQIPSSFRTTLTPSTMFTSFCFAAHRAVCERPQSGAKTRRSAGACFRHNRTRSATTSGVST